MTVVEILKKSLLLGHSAGAVFYDFSDAFGSVDRSRLLHKIHKDFGITGHLYDHLSSFLSERKARLKIGDLIGNWLESEFGTSAGTHLGPMLFIVHLHDIPRCIRPKFADDLVAVSVAHNVSEIESELQ